MAIPRRIVSLISSATEILYLLDLGQRVVGVSHECDYPQDVATKPRLTRSLVDAAASSRQIDDEVRALAASQSALYTIDRAQLAELKPDLVITQAQCDVCAVRYEDVVAAIRAVPSLDRTEILALNPYSLDDVLADVARIGKATGAEQAAHLALAGLRARIDAVRDRTASLTQRSTPRVACLEWIDPPMLAANWTPKLVEMAGGEPGLVTAGQHSTYADWGQIVAYDPQFIAIMPCGFGLERAIVESQVLVDRQGWHDLSAVRDSRVFACDGNAYFNRSGPRLVDSLEILAHLIHPDLFGPPLGNAQQAWRRLKTDHRVLVPEQP